MTSRAGRCTGRTAGVAAVDDLIAVVAACVAVALLACFGVYRAVIRIGGWVAGRRDRRTARSNTPR